MKRAILLFLLISLNCPAQLNDKRTFQLDSIVSTIPANIKKDASGVHKYLDSLGKTDEEKVWMFYGFIGTYLTYDHKRMRDFKAPGYSPYTTVKKGSGICGDMSDLFDFFCAKSKIPCYKVLGKSTTRFWNRLNRFIHGVDNSTNHQWNIVKFNNVWQLMDPTWSGVETVKSITVYDKKGIVIKRLKIKSVKRDYYNASPEFMSKSHAPINPIFYMLTAIPNYKSALKKRNKKFYCQQFEFNCFLDQGITKQYEEFNNVFDSLSFYYCDKRSSTRQFLQILYEPLLKRTEYNSFNLETYKQDSLACADLYSYYQKEFKSLLPAQYKYFLAAHQKLKEKYIKSQATKKN